MFDKELILKEIAQYGLEKEIKADELLKHHTSWKIGGIADFFSIPSNVVFLKKVISFAIEYELPIYIIGNGSNLWVPDEGLRGIVIKVSGTIDKIEYSGKMIKVGSGILLPYLVKETVKKELSGLEFAAHIPGTLGGAIINNASFNNKSMADVVKKITILDYNGTIALDGMILSEVKARIIEISNLGLNIYVLTADTHGTVKSQCVGLPIEIKIFDNSSARKNKEAIVEELGGRSCIAIGNGFNDGLMFEKSALGIIVLGNEGCSTKSLMKAEIMCKSIEDALDLILKKDRVVATLRG